jgi:hypothetical protein
LWGLNNLLQLVPVTIVTHGSGVRKGNYRFQPILRIARRLSFHEDGAARKNRPPEAFSLASSLLR